MTVIVKIEHVKKAGMCTRGARMWAHRYGFDYMRFLREGIPATELEATGDAMGIRVAQIAKAAASKSNGGKAS